MGGVAANVGAPVRTGQRRAPPQQRGDGEILCGCGGWRSTVAVTRGSRRFQGGGDATVKRAIGPPAWLSTRPRPPVGRGVGRGGPQGGTREGVWPRLGRGDQVRGPSGCGSWSPRLLWAGRREPWCGPLGWNPPRPPVGPGGDPDHLVGTPPVPSPSPLLQPHGNVPRPPHARRGDSAQRTAADGAVHPNRRRRCGLRAPVRRQQPAARTTLACFRERPATGRAWCWRHGTPVKHLHKERRQGGERCVFFFISLFVVGVSAQEAVGGRQLRSVPTAAYRYTVYTKT